jgi:hypothetical protein
LKAERGKHPAHFCPTIASDAATKLEWLLGAWPTLSKEYKELLCMTRKFTTTDLMVPQ